MSAHSHDHDHEEHDHDHSEHSHPHAPSAASSEAVQELRILEQQHQQFLMQKQQFQFEQNQINNAITETKKSDGDVYRVISGALIKVKKPELIKELEEKKKTVTMRIDSIEKQEKLIDDRMDSLQKELRNLLAKDKK